MAEKMDLYDSATGEVLLVEKSVELAAADGDNLSLIYTTAKRGRICQVRRGSIRIHYFIDEPEGQAMIAEDEERNRVSYADMLRYAPAALSASTGERT